MSQRVTLVPIADTIRANGSAVAPGAGSNFVATTAPPKGVYEIRGGYIITAAQETAALNIRLLANAVGVVDFPTAMTFGSAQVVPFHIPRIELNGTDIVALRAVVAAVAATVYAGWLCVSRIY